MNRIVFFDQYADAGGGQYVLRDLIRRLAPLSSIEVVLPSGTFAKTLELDGVQVATYASQVEAVRVAAVRLDIPTDHVVVNGLRSLPVALASKRLVHRRQESASSRVTYIDHSTPGSRLRRALKASLLRAVDSTINVASSQRSSAKTLTTIPPLGLTRVQGDQLRTQLPTRWSGKVKAFGRLDPVKGLDLIGQVAQQLEELAPQGIAVAVRPPLEQGGAAYAAETTALLGGLVDLESRGPEWFEPGDIVLVPSRSEAASLTVQEAALRGAYVVGADVGDISDLLSGGAGGGLFRAGDAGDMLRAVTEAVQMGASDFARSVQVGRARTESRLDGWYRGVSDYLRGTPDE